jgi:hypothetical protein
VDCPKRSPSRSPPAAPTASYGATRDDENTPCVTFEHPEFCAVAYDPETRQPTAAAKAWFDDDTEVAGNLTLYTADQVWKWKWSVPKDADARRQLLWEPREGDQDDTWPIPNPLGVVPMVEFRNAALLDDRPISDLAGVAAMQDAINLVWAYLFNGLDFATLPQRVAMGADFPKIPVLDEQGQVVGDKPADLKSMYKDRVFWITGENASIGSWPAANLEVFNSVIGLAVDHVAAQTRTPPHYLIGKMANMAAEALTVAETGWWRRLSSGKRTSPARSVSCTGGSRSPRATRAAPTRPAPGRSCGPTRSTGPSARRSTRSRSGARPVCRCGSSSSGTASSRPRSTG